MKLKNTNSWNHHIAKTKARRDEQKAMMYPLVPELLAEQIPPALKIQLASLVVQVVEVAIAQPAAAEVLQVANEPVQ